MLWKWRSGWRNRVWGGMRGNRGQWRTEIVVLVDGVGCCGMGDDEV